MKMHIVRRGVVRVAEGYRTHRLARMLCRILNESTGSVDVAEIAKRMFVNTFTVQHIAECMLVDDSVT